MLDGNADVDIAGKNCYEDEAWHAVWKAVPKYLPASKTDEHGNTIYRVEEKSGDGYEAAGSSVAAETGTDAENARKTTERTTTTEKAITLPEN